MVCSNCGAENPAGNRFCRKCGASLVLACPTCGSPVEPGDRFCGTCGADLGTPAPALVAAQTPVAERRLVSVLFADLVGFTPLSETLDPEEVRDVLTRYFDTARRLVARYGGTVEKFIGDAVMAVWGTPIAQEDDAERAVRAALDLVSAVAALGEQVGAPELRARAGVLTGEVAVTLGAEGQGMVAGDLVNTASRVQATAPPGAVYVGDVTRRATEAAIAYQDAGSHELKGKAEPLPLWRADRVIAARGGALRSTGLEAPFVGRDRELRLVKELFHASAEEGKAHLLSVIGIAGIGKSRLSWEFFKYIDGLVDNVWWHRGRCLAYGEGVSYWALAEMVRTRARIAEEEDPTQARKKLAATVEEIVTEPGERRWIEPRLAHLLGLEDRVASEREDLFSGWRMFFERLAERSPVVMVFEDLQWADEAMMSFIEYLLEWSRSYPLFVMVLARPELTDRRPTWGAGRRNFTSMALEPLSTESMDGLLAGLVPGLPEDLRVRIRDRAEGVPLYAVETVRMLIDRGLLQQEGSRYAPTGPIGELEVPETLHALIAARLDGLAPSERSLLTDASVLGKTFTSHALSALTGLADGELAPVLSSLVRKEVLGLQTDARSPERGQYGFLQALVRKVAYETLARRDRKARHLAVADYLQSSWAGDEDEIVQVVAAHYLDALRAAPDAPDAPEIKAKAREALSGAARRAFSLAAHLEAQRYFEQAADLADGPLTRAELLERAGVSAGNGGRGEEAIALFEAAIALFEAEGRTHAAARVSARLGEQIWWVRDQVGEGLRRMEASFELLSGDEADEDLAALAAELARLHFFAGNLDLAVERADFALRVAEALWLPAVMSQALNTKHLVLVPRGHKEEALALLKHALEIALDNDAGQAALRAYINLSNMMSELDRYDAAVEYEVAGIELAKRLGFGSYRWFLTGHLVGVRWVTGRWDEALETARQIPPADEGPDARVGSLVASVGVIRIHVARGETEDAESQFEAWMRSETDDVQVLATRGALGSVLSMARQDAHRALELSMVAVGARGSLALSHPAVREGIVSGIEAALHLNDIAKAEELIGILEQEPRGLLPPFLQAQASRLRSKLTAQRGSIEGVDLGFRRSAGLLREIGMPFHLAVVLLEHGEWLIEQGRSEEATPLLAEARGTFQGLRAIPWGERLDASAQALTAHAR